MNAQIEAKVDKTLERNCRNCWNRDYPEDPKLADWSDEQLAAFRKQLPRDVGERSEQQKREGAAAYKEQYRRWSRAREEARWKRAEEWRALEQAGQWPSGWPLPKAGDAVASVAAGWGGMPFRVTGRVLKPGADGWPRVRIDKGQPVAGAKTTLLTPGWKTIQAKGEVQ